MKPLRVGEYISQHYEKVLAQSRPNQHRTKTTFAIFDHSTETGAFCGLLSKHDVDLHPDWTFEKLLQHRPQPVLSVNTTIRQALTLMKKEKIFILPVLDQANRLAGIVSHAYLLQILYQHEHSLLRQAKKLRLEQTKNYKALLAHSTELQKAVTQAEERINKMIRVDHLTGLPNLIEIREKIDLLLNQSPGLHNQGAILLIGLDNFRNINTLVGSHTGDQILQQVSARIADNLRKNDILARKGGDEFIIVLLDIDSPDSAIFTARNILHALTEPFTLNEQDVYMTASVGISFYPFGIQNAEMLLANADIALEQAKEIGKNNYQIFLQEMADKAQLRKKMEKCLRQALDQNELFLCYQPQIELNSNRIIGLEALLRWRNPELGLILPADFIPLAEKTSLIIPIGDWVLQTACQQIKAWQQPGKPLRVAVNLSARQFQGTDGQSSRQLMKTLESILEKTELAPQSLEVEITESIIVKNYDVAMNTLKQLRHLGVRISCDDFGTGYSSLNYLKQLPFDTIKIDKSFINDITYDPVDLAIIRAIIDMARQLNIQVVAEGIEHEEQLTILRELGCNIIQGYYFSKPLSLDEANLFLKTGF